MVISCWDRWTFDQRSRGPNWKVLDAVAEKLKPGGASRSEPNDEADAITRYSLDSKEMRNKCPNSV
ncbi:hypothetical protein SynBIOSU31_01180 [Synechococcus sp. BIOS-U3-1]|nr:hypothetical protein SynBIOSU31_01180 [Synechococcus sp. BIOS-U3-1]